MYRKMNASVSKAYNYILDQIMSYNLAPGAVVSDSQLAKELGISRAPVREAILMLIMDGLIQSLPDSKTVVTPIMLEDISDIFHVRAALETEAIRIIAANGWLQREQIQELYLIHEHFLQTNFQTSFVEHYQYDNLFHSTLIGFAKSPRIENITTQLSLQVRRIRWLSLLDVAHQDVAVVEHKEILTAIQEKDCEKTIRWLNQHIRQSSEFFQHILSDTNMRQLAMTINSLMIAPSP